MESAKFKVGDEVKYKDYGQRFVIAKLINDGESGVLEHLDGNSGWGRDGSVPSKYEPVGRNVYWYYEAGKITLVKARSGRVEKTKSIKFALQYELDQDPTEYFATLPEVKARIKELSTRGDLKRDQIFIHEIKNTRKVELGVSISLKRA